MTWQFAILIYIIISSLLALYTRHVALRTDRTFFTIGALMYIVIATVGVTTSILHNNGALPPLPSQEAWLYIILEGTLIPLSWLAGYRLVRKIGAGNTAVAQTSTIITAVLLGALLLGEPITGVFVVGSVCIIGATFLSLTIKASVHQGADTPIREKILLISAQSALITLGIFFEKKAIDLITSWDYMAYGWAMQCVMALVFFALFGKKERRFITPKVVKQGFSLGAFTAASGMVFVLSLGLGAFSSTMAASAGKIALTLVLAALFLREYNSPVKRIVAFGVMCIGLYFVMQAT